MAARTYQRESAVSTLTVPAWLSLIGVAIQRARSDIPGPQAPKALCKRDCLHHVHASCLEGRMFVPDILLPISIKVCVVRSLDALTSTDDCS